MVHKKFLLWKNSSLNNYNWKKIMKFGEKDDKRSMSQWTLSEIWSFEKYLLFWCIPYAVPLNSSLRVTTSYKKEYIFFHYHCYLPSILVIAFVGHHCVNLVDCCTETTKTNLLRVVNDTRSRFLPHFWHIEVFVSVNK